MDGAGPRRSLWPWLLLILLVLILLLAGWGGWRGWQLWQTQQQSQQSRFHALKTQLGHSSKALDDLRGSLGAATDRVHSNSQNLTTLQGRVDGIGHSVDTLNEVVRGGRQRVQMDEVEQLLLTANDEVQLAQNPVTADRALAAADARLAALNSPRLFDLRKTIAQERTALEAVNEPDIIATALSLSQLIEQLPQLPLREPSHALKPATPTPTVDDSTQSGWFSRGWHRVGSALRSLFHLRRTDHEIKPMLTQAQAPLVGEVLSLRLDTARAALVQRNTPLYRSALDSAQQWIRQYYNVDDPTVQNGLDQLTKLSKLDLSPSLPDISQSVEQLRSLRDHAPD